MSGAPLPTTMAVRDLLEGMLGRDVEVLAGTDAVTPATEPGVVAGVYVTGALQSEALVAMDLPLAAWVGAAIALIPPGGAEAAIEDRALSEGLLENVSEVLNVAASLFNVDDAPHLKLSDVHDSARQLLPADVATWLRSYGPRVDATVTVKGYGPGQLSILTR